MIVGAGLAGLIAAHAFPTLPIVESQPQPTSTHKALLRFRSSAVGDLVGVEFRPVTVHKGIWYKSQWHEPNIKVANMYSLKVLGKIMQRSIWNIDSVTRWIAPDDLYERMVNSVGHRVQWGLEYDYGQDEIVINTAPISVPLDALGLPRPHLDRAPITVLRYRVHQCEAYQTVYYPAITHNMYRASITGDTLICEFAGAVEDPDIWQDELWDSMHINVGSHCEPLGAVEQRYGKIAPIDEGMRKALISRLTRDHKIFSLGRYGTWRNILLDDVVHDTAVVKRLITATDYERQLASL